MVGIRDDTERQEEKAKGIPRAWCDKPIDHTRVCMASHLAEIRAKVMWCMPTINVSTAHTLNRQDRLIQTTQVAAHGKIAAPLFDQV